MASETIRLEKAVEALKDLLRPQTYMHIDTIKKRMSKQHRDADIRGALWVLVDGGMAEFGFGHK